MAPVSTPAFWEDLYARREDGWDLGGPHPSLVYVLDTAAPPRGRVAVPGCGRGHDAIELARRGYDVVGFDFAAVAVREARERAEQAGVTARFEQRDIFALEPEWDGTFDGAWEHTCFCAIDPARRDDYVDVLARLVKPGGWLLACFFPLREGDGGPPFPVQQADVRRRLGTAFRIERDFAPPRPAERRAGLEWMVVATRVARAA